MIVPNDLQIELNKRPIALEFYLRLSRPVKKILLSWLVLAKREETRQKRIIEIVEQADKKLKPKHLQY